MEQCRECAVRTRAQTLRKNATKEENHLWYDFLRTYPVQFLRQRPFGPYIVDFYCHSARLAIELDGSQHYEGQGPEQDAARTAYLQEVEKIRVLRFTNLDVKQNFEGVCATIELELQKTLPSSVWPSASHHGSRKKSFLLTVHRTVRPPGEGFRADAVRPRLLSFHIVHNQILPVENPVEIVQTFVRKLWSPKNVTGKIYKFVISCGSNLL